MSLARAFEDYLFAFLARGEVVAGDSIPSETAVHGEPSGFTFSKRRGIL